MHTEPIHDDASRRYSKRNPGDRQRSADGAQCDNTGDNIHPVQRVQPVHGTSQCTRVPNADSERARREAYRRAIGTPRRGIGAATVTKLVARARKHHSGDLIAATERLAEERWLFYVAATRAKDRLLMTHAAERGRRPSGGPLRFLAEAGLHQAPSLLAA